MATYSSISCLEKKKNPMRSKELNTTDWNMTRSPDIFICKRNGEVLWWFFSIFLYTLSILYCYMSYSKPLKADPSESIFPVPLPTRVLLGWTSEMHQQEVEADTRGEGRDFFSLLWAASFLVRASWSLVNSSASHLVHVESVLALPLQV